MILRLMQLYKDATTELDPAKAVAKWTAFHAYGHDQYVSIGVVMVKPVSSNWSQYRLHRRQDLDKPVQDSYDGFVPKAGIK